MVSRRRESQATMGLVEISLHFRFARLSVMGAVAALLQMRRPARALIEVKYLRHVDRVRIAIGEALQVPVGLDELEHAGKLGASDR